MVLIKANISRTMPRFPFFLHSFLVPSFPNYIGKKCVRIFFKPVFCKYIAIYLGFESLFSYFTLNENLCGKNASLSKIAFFLEALPLDLEQSERAYPYAICKVSGGRLKIISI